MPSMHLATNRRQLFGLAAGAAALLSTGRLAYAAKAQVFATGSNLAIRGYDPVAYFSDDKAVKGSPDHAVDWNGATWLFASAENKTKFEADPERYAPQYGGYCAWAVSQGYTASTDPDAYSIVDGKLYLNYSKRVRATWAKDAGGNIKRGDANWPGVLN